MSAAQLLSDALLLLEQGGVERGEAILGEAVALAEREPDELVLARALCALGELLLLQGRREEAVPRLTRVMGLLRADGLTDEERAKARLLLRRGPDEAAWTRERARRRGLKSEARFFEKFFRRRSFVGVSYDEEMLASTAAVEVDGRVVYEDLYANDPDAALGREIALLKKGWAAERNWPETGMGELCGAVARRLGKRLRGDSWHAWAESVGLTPEEFLTLVGDPSQYGDDDRYFF